MSGHEEPGGATPPIASKNMGEPTITVAYNVTPDTARDRMARRLRPRKRLTTIVTRDMPAISSPQEDGM